jgi:hypothetical protein
MIKREELRQAVLVLLLTTSATVTGCGPAATVDAELNDRSDDFSSAPAVPAGAVPAAFLELAKTQYSGHGASSRVVIRDLPAWETFWLGIVAGVSPQPPLPAIDFARHTVLAATMGQRSSAGYAIEIDSVFVSNETVYAVVKSISPGPDCGVAAVLTAPVVAVRIDRLTGPIRFVERSEEVDCG